jgi:hypothetical protein
MRKGLLVLLVLAALAIPAAAAADSCANFSRQAPACNLSCTSLVTVGNWIWLPSLTTIGVPADELPPAWGFAPPGRADSVALQLPGENGNYTNGQTSSLLGMSALCRGTNSVALFKRQDGAFFVAFGDGPPDFSALHGVWSGCE